MIQRFVMLFYCSNKESDLLSVIEMSKGGGGEGLELILYMGEQNRDFFFFFWGGGGLPTISLSAPKQIVLIPSTF